MGTRRVAPRFPAPRRAPLGFTCCAKGGWGGIPPSPVGEVVCWRGYMHATPDGVERERGERAADCPAHHHRPEAIHVQILLRQERNTSTVISAAGMQSFDTNSHTVTQVQTASLLLFPPLWHSLHFLWNQRTKLARQQMTVIMIPLAGFFFKTLEFDFALKNKHLDEEAHFRIMSSADVNVTSSQKIQANALFKRMNGPPLG